MSTTPATLQGRATTTSSDGGRFDARTRILSVYRVAEPALAPAPAFEVAHAQLSALAARATAPAFACALVDPDGRLRGAALLPPGGTVTAGRHSQCGLRLREADAPLRALTALVVSGESGAQPQLRVWDLASGQPFRTEDGAPAGAVVAEGATYLALGSYALWFVPVASGTAWPAAPAEAFSALPPRIFVDRRPPDAPAPAIERPEPSGQSTRITRVGPPLFVGEDAGPELAWGTLRVCCCGERSVRGISAEQLERGVLVGRYERCRLRLDGDGEVSRVHALLVRLGSDVWAVDTASTYGLALDGQLLEAAVLPDGGELALSDQTSLEWRRSARAGA